MIVGFTIVDFKGHEEAAVEYIQRVCILEDSAIARNIVSVGPGVNVFSEGVTLSELQAQPFESTPIEVENGKYLVASAVNFNLELLYKNEILRLNPTEYIYVDPSELAQFDTYVRQGLVIVLPKIIGEGNYWILREGFWDDDGIWVDSDIWRDSDEQ